MNRSRHSCVLIVIVRCEKWHLGTVPSSPSRSGSISVRLRKLHVGDITVAYPGSPSLIFMKCVCVSMGVRVSVMCLRMGIRMCLL